MNARLVTVLAVISMLPAAVGCGSIRNSLFGRGAACGVCPSAAPTFNVPPPAYGAPAPSFGGPAPSFGAPQVCPTPDCGQTYGGPTYGGQTYGGQTYGDSCGCGGEGSYYGNYGYGGEMYPSGNVIGTPMMGTGINGGYPSDAYNLNNWTPSVEPNYVPGSATYTDGIPAAGMAPIRRGT